MERHYQISRAIYAAVLALTLAATGCVSVPTASVPRKQSGASYTGTSAAQVERVFRYESRVANALLDRFPLHEDFIGADPALVTAEARMNDRCSAVTQVVMHTLEKNPPSWLLRLQAMRSLGKCERATRRVERLLNLQAQAPTHTLASAGKL